MSAGVRWFRGTATGFVGPLAIDTNIYQAETILVGDIDGLAISFADRIDLYERTIDPRDPWTATTIDGAFGGTGNTRLATGDFNLDGRPELAVSSQSAEEIRVYIQDTAAWIPLTVIGSWTGANFVAAGDLDGDQRDDVATTT